VASDPALASKVLALCRCHDRGRAGDVRSIDRAVLLLGFEAVRCAVLSVKVFDLVDGISSAGGELRGQPVFDREAYWLHSLGVAVASEQIVGQATMTKSIRPSEAFIAGLLHDIGQLALHVLLPDSFDQVCRVAETHGASLDGVCRQIIGLDTHTAGKRLAEHWGLPQALVDVIWLNGQPLEALPDGPTRPLISLVTLADALIRNHYISPGAHWLGRESISTLSIPVGIETKALTGIIEPLHEQVTERAKALGMGDSHAPGVLLRSICRANETLARANAGMRQRERIARRHAQSLAAINDFLDSLPRGQSVAEVLTRIAASASTVLQRRVVAALSESDDAEGLRLTRYHATGRPFGSTILAPPDGTIPLPELVRDIRTTAPAAAMMPWLDGLIGPGVDLAQLHMLPIPAPSVCAALLLETATEPIAEREEIEGLFRCWQAALSGGAEHDAAVRLTERLASSHRTLLETREALSRSRTMGTLGEVAAGAAHEMNNPLTIISGRAQILANRLKDPEQHQMAAEIFAQSHRLSDMISALRSFAEPVTPKRLPLELANLVVRVVQRLSPHEQRQPQINTIFAQPIPLIRADADLLGDALCELVRNATESKGCRHIELRVQTDPLDDRLKIEVRDDGEGLTEHTLEHAFDPFFSVRPAGRQPGLGLARARRSVEAHGGQVTLACGPHSGAVATIWLSDWRVPEHVRPGREPVEPGQTGRSIPSNGTAHESPDAGESVSNETAQD